MTALVVHDLFGGQLLEAEVHFHDGSRQGFHYWNRLPRGDVDLTREQLQTMKFSKSPVSSTACPSSRGLPTSNISYSKGVSTLP